ncbi:MAG TPA: response regulator [Parvibaculum sp.]
MPNTMIPTPLREPPAPGKGPYAKLAVLVVEDTPHMAGLICGILKSIGVGQIHQARTGEKALQMLAGHEIHIAIIDDLEPPLDGLAVVKTIRTAQADLPNAVPVVFVTERKLKSAIIEARDAGVTEILLKPFSAIQLIARLDAVLARPRPLVKSAGFVGPDRRRRSSAAQVERRQGQGAPAAR